MSVRDMEVARKLLKIDPSLVKSEESVNNLVMKGVVDFNTGMEMIQSISSSESEENVPGIKEDGTSEVPESGIRFPDKDEATVVKLVMELASDDEKAAFDKLLDQLNVAFQSAYKKRRSDINRVVSQVIEITDKDVQESTKIMDVIKDDKFVLIKK